MISRHGAVLACAGLALAGVGFVLSWAFGYAARRWAPVFGLVDHPAASHKTHKTPTPLGGGVAIWLSVVLVVGAALILGKLAEGNFPEEIDQHVQGTLARSLELAEILGLASLIMVMGLLDDRIGLGWRIRLVVQFGLAILLAASGTRVTLFWPFTHPLLGGALTVFWVVGLTNAFNMLDNMDGLSAGVGLIAAGLFAGAQIAVGSLFTPAVLLVLVGALGGFLKHNRYPARLFMGDAGSNFLGFLLGALTVAGTYFRYDRVSPYSVLAPLLVMAVPLYDSMSVILIRIREGRSPFLGDRCHFSHRLIERGLTKPQAVRTINLVTLASGLGALLLHRLDKFGAFVVVAQTACLLGVVAILELTRQDRSATEMARRGTQRTVPTKPVPASKTLPEQDVDGDAQFAAWLGEQTRRVALGLIAALVVARAYWPSEPDLSVNAGTGLIWDLAILITAGLAIAAPLIGGTCRLRFSWTDVAVVALMFLVGMSSTQAHDRRTAINLAWDWAAVGFAYVLFRMLPRTRGESSALLAGLVATAVAVAVYGLYQVGVELAPTRAYYAAHKFEVLRQLNIPPGSPAEAMYEDRLLHSNEPMSTFALANSLAGFLVGPLVVMAGVMWKGFSGPGGLGARIGRVALAVLPALAVLVCLILTKSRSAAIGLVVGLAILAWRERSRVRARTVAIAILGGAAVVAAVVVAGFATGHLDKEVLTEAPKSLRYRWEYWVGAWRVITDRKTDAFWKGHGPGNFTAPYLIHKVPESSEELYDPHNLVLEVWATAGVGAMVALVAALGLAFFNLLVPSKTTQAPPEAPIGPPDPSDPPRRSGWLVACAGGGWILASIVGGLDPFAGEQFWRWLILGGAWLWAVLLVGPVWRRLPVEVTALGAGALAIAVNLLAAGGIGIPGVALMLWLMIALGLNLREDRSCGRLRNAGGRTLSFGMAMVWVALLGSFVGAVRPYWEAEAALAVAEKAIKATPPKFDVAQNAYEEAQNIDKYGSRAYFGLAFLMLQEWKSRGAKPDDLRWKTIAVAITKAIEPPRNAKSWSLHRERALVIRGLIQELGNQMKPVELTIYRGNVVQASRTATRLYPSNASLHALLAEASADLGVYSDAVKEANEALRLDALTPHRDKKLPDAVRKRLVSALPKWQQTAPGTPDIDKLQPK